MHKKKRNPTTHFKGTFWTYSKVWKIRFVELQENTKMITTKVNYIQIANERSLYLNDLLGIILVVLLDIFNKMDT